MFQGAKSAVLLTASTDCKKSRRYALRLSYNLAIRPSPRGRFSCPVIFGRGTTRSADCALKRKIFRQRSLRGAGADARRWSRRGRWHGDWGGGLAAGGEKSGDRADD